MNKELNAKLNLEVISILENTTRGLKDVFRKLEELEERIQSLELENEVGGSSTKTEVLAHASGKR